MTQFPVSTSSEQSIHAALELSKNSWLLAIQVPGRDRGDQTRGAAFYDSFPETLEAEDIARAIIYALEQPARVTVAQIVVVPSHEA